MATPDFDAIASALRSAVGPDRVAVDAPVGMATTYRVGGPAALVLDVDVADELVAAAAILGSSGVSVRALGRGSNLLIADRGFAGCIVRLGETFGEIDIDGQNVRAGGAASLPVVARTTVAAGLAGFEWAVGVPGSIGGAVRMNAGGHGSDMAASVVHADIVDMRTGDTSRWEPAQLAFDYRSSAIGDHHFVVAATLTLSVADDPTAGPAELREIVAWRRSHQPGGQNAGSVFTNPPGDSAGRLIDAAGCRGLRIGTASVSDKHANFIQADAGGRAADVFELMCVVRERVAATFGIVLHPETHLVGFTDDERARLAAVPHDDEESCR